MTGFHHSICVFGLTEITGPYEYKHWWHIVIPLIMHPVELGNVFCMMKDELWIGSVDLGQ